MANRRSSKGPTNSVSYSQIFMADLPPTSQELVLPDARQETPHHQSETADEIESFCQRHHSKRTLGFKYNFVGRNASYKKVTLILASDYNGSGRTPAATPPTSFRQSERIIPPLPSGIVPESAARASGGSPESRRGHSKLRAENRVP